MNRHSFIVRKFNRVFYKLARFFLGYLSLVSHRFYMKFMNRLLASNGMTLNGSPRYISPNCYFDALDKISLSQRVVISTNVSFLTHDYSLTTALIAIGEAPDTDVATDREIKVGPNVFIGRGVIVMPNTEIGENCIIGAGTVVRGKIPPNSIVIGNPCQVVGDIREFAQRWKAKLDTDMIRKD